MKLHEFVDQSYQTFADQIKNVRIVLLHPESRYRSMLVARLVNSPDYDVFYYAMGPDDINLHGFIGSITQALAYQHPTFGRHTNVLPPEVFENPQDHMDLVLDTFVQDLAEIPADNPLLVLDEYDRSDSADDVQSFVNLLSTRLPGGYRMVLNGRTLPRLPWVAMIAQGRAVMLKDDVIIRERFYGDENEKSEDGLEVYALGPGFVLQAFEPVDSWEGHLPRLLFFFALDRPVITRSEICQAFWPELDPDQAVNVFHVTKRRLHKALDTDVLVHSDGYYQVNPEMEIYYDVAEFVSHLMQARVAEKLDAKMASWQKAADLYRGPFLQGHSDAWIEERRAEYRDGYLEALTAMAAVWRERGRNEQALSLLEKAMDADFSREDVHRSVLELYITLGRSGEAAAHYQKFVDMLAELGREPSDDMVQDFGELVG